MTLCPTHRSEHHQPSEKLLLLVIAINKDIHIWIVSREHETLKHSALHGMSLPKDRGLGSGGEGDRQTGSYVEEKVERLQEPAGMYDAKETLSSGQDSIDTHMNSQRL